jgi:hypothetical protein
VLSALLAVALAGSLVAGVSWVLLQKAFSGSLQYTALYDAPQGSCDVMAIGNSHVYSDIAPHVLYSEFGIASLNFATSGATGWQVYYQLVEALKYQTPQVVLIEASCFRVSNEWNESIGFQIAPMRPSMNKLDDLTASAPPKERVGWVFDISITHNRVFELAKSSFTNYQDRPLYREFKGYELRVPWGTLTESQQKTREFGFPADFSRELGEGPYEEPATITDKQQEYLVKIIELCKEKGIALEMVLSPSYLALDPAYVKATCEEYGVPFIDYVADSEELALDYQEDFGDTDHLSYLGAEKWTRVLYRDVLEKYQLPDRRGDAAYSSWDVNAEVMAAKTKGYDINASPLMEDMRDQLAKGPQKGVQADVLPSSELPYAHVPEALPVAAGDKGSPYALILNLSNNPTDPDRRMTVGDVVGFDLPEEAAEADSGAWLVRDGSAERLDGPSLPYVELGSVVVDYRYVCAFEADAEVSPDLLLDNILFTASENRVQIAVYDERLDEVVSRRSLKKKD